MYSKLTNSLVNFKFITAYTENDQGSVKSRKPIHTGEGPAYAGRYARDRFTSQNWL